MTKLYNGEEVELLHLEKIRLPFGTTDGQWVRRVRDDKVMLLNPEYLR